MRRSLTTVAILALALTACGSETGSGEVILVNSAADESFGPLLDAELRGDIIVDDAQAAALLDPQDGARIGDMTPYTFVWSQPFAARKVPRHGTCTGWFVWLQFSGGGLSRDIDVVAVGVDSYTPSGATWDELRTASGPITVTLTTAYESNCILEEGPFRRTSNPSFTIETGW